jgi:hypothetical protein
MSEETHKVKLLGVKGEQIDAVFSFDYDQEPCTLRLHYFDQELVATEADYFEALCTIRRELEAKGLRPQCYGASRNVFPSGMSRNMGEGIRAYKMKMGSPTTMEDLVFIFDSGADVEAVSVAEQDEYHKQWIKSLGG